MLLLAAKPVIEARRARLREAAEKIRQRIGRPPHLTVILVGDDPASQVYVAQKGKAALDAGMTHDTIRLPDTTGAREVREVVARLNADEKVDGILLQRPLPKSFAEEEVVYWVAPAKDVDAFHPETTGRLHLGLPSFAPCTPAGVIAILEHYQIDVRGKLACVIGRSAIVGKPMAALLLQRDATVIQAHSKTKDLAKLASSADLLVVAAGKPRLIGTEFVKPGAVVIDVGIHRGSDGKLCGDVRFDEVSRHASAITPVPGGVGPMTIQILLENTALAAGRATP